MKTTFSNHSLNNKIVASLQNKRTLYWMWKSQKTLKQNVLRSLMLSVIAVLCFDVSFAQWATVGSAGFSTGQVLFTSLSIDNSGTPYVAFKDVANSNKTTVMKYNGSSWVTVGSAGFSAGGIHYPSLAINGSGTPYVSYTDGGNVNKITVMKYSGANWVNVGSAGFSAGMAWFTSIAIDGSGTPYVAYEDQANGFKATVMKYNSGSWVTVGSAGFSGSNAENMSLAIDGSGTPYVAYIDGSNGSKATVMKYNGSNWVTVGSAVSAGGAEFTSLAIDGSGTPYVAYKDSANGARATVKKYNGASWVTVGSPGFSAGVTFCTSLAIDDSGLPYVAYRDVTNGNRATVMKYNGSSWVTVGTAGFTPNVAYYTSLVLDGNGKPWLGHQDGFNKASVMKFVVGPITGATTVCAGTTSTLANAITGGTWSSGSPDIATVGSSNGVVTGVTVGYSWITYTVPGGSNAVLLNVIASPNAGTITGISSVVTGNTITLSNAAAGGAWSSSNASRATVGSNGIVSGVALGTVVISYTKTSAGCSAAVATKTVSVTPPTGWSKVGSPGFSTGTAIYNTLTISRNGTPYVTYNDDAADSNSVMKYNGSNWVLVGSRFAATYSNYASLAVDGSDVPYVAYGDQSNGFKATVKKYNGSSWVTVGSAGFSAGSAYHPSLAIDGSGMPYVAYNDSSNSYKVTVKKYNGSSWVTVGSAGFSAASTQFLSLAVDGSGTPYVAYDDNGNGSKASVMKYNGSSWVTVGTAGFSAGDADNTSIVIDGSGTPYVAYTDNGNGGKASVMKYNGSNWVNVGSPGFSAGFASWPSLAIDRSGTPYVAYSAYGQGKKATVMKYDGSNWINVGIPEFSTGICDYCSIAVDSNGTPHVAYTDWDHPYKATVEKFSMTPISGATTVCAGATATFSNATPGGIWRSSHTGRATVDSLSGIVTGVAGGIVTISYTAMGVSRTAAVTVSPLPNAGYITGPPSVDAGSTITLSDAVAGGTWASSNTSVATVGSSGIVSAVTPGTVTISYTTTNSCGSTTAPAYLTVRPPSGWHNVGNLGFSAGQALYTSLDIDGAGTPYLAYTDAAISNKATVKKYTGGSWVNVGSAGFSAGMASYISLAVDGSGTPYVAYKDYSYGEKATVKKYNGSSWVTVGSVGFSADDVDDLSLAIDGSGTPYLAYHDYGNGHKATVMKYNGSSWVTTGIAGFSASYAHDLSLAIDLGGTPYVAYRDAGNSYKATVMKYNGSSWVTVGSAGFTPGGGISTSLAIDTSGTPYVAYRDAANGMKASVMKYDGSSWVNVGSAGFSPGQAYVPTLALDRSGTPYVAYGDGEFTGLNVTVMKYDGSAWINVGGAGFSSSTAYTPSLAIDTSGIPYVAYGDLGYGSKATVKIFGLAAITGVTTACVGTTTTLGNAIAGGVWSSGDMGVAAIGSSNGVVTGVATGTAVITYSLATSSVTAIVTVNGLPNAGTITGASAVSMGATITLSNAAAGGAWNASNISATVSSTGVVMGVIPGAVVISYSKTNSCGTSYAIKELLVDNGALCPGQSVRLATTVSCFDHLFSPVTDTGSVGTGTWTLVNDTLITLYSWSFEWPTTLVYGSDTTRRYGYIESTVRKTGSSPENNVGIAMDVTLGQPGGYYLRLNDSGVLKLHNGPNYTFPKLDSVYVGTSLFDWNKLRLEVTFDGYVKGYLNDTLRITYNIPGGIPPAGRFGLAATNYAYEFRNTTQYYSQGSFLWNTGATTPVITVSPAATTTYQCTATTSCGTHIDNLIVSIMPLPNAGTITGASSVSAGDTITLTKSAGGGAWSASNSNATISPTGVVTGVSAGTVTISYTVMNSCDTAVATKNITVTTPAIVCINSTLTLSGITPGGTWSSSNATKATVNAAGVVTGVSAGTVNISYNVPGSSVVTVVTVNTTPTAITGSLSICNGATTTLGSTPAGGTWSSAAPAVAEVSASGVLSGVSIGNAAISYTLSNGCSRSAVATINNVPTAITGSTTVCVGATSSLSSMVPGGVFSSANSSIATTSIGGTLTGVAAGTTLISYSIGGCRVTAIATVIAAPPAITGTPAACVGTTTSLSNATPGGIWTSSNGAVAMISGSGNVTGMIAGTSTISYTLPTGCIRSVVVAINAIPVIGGPSVVCVDGSINLTSTPATTLWTSSAPSKASVTLGGLVTGMVAGTTTISVMTTAGCANSTVISVNPQPTITGTQTVCLNATTSLTGTAAGGTWTSSSTGIASINSSGVVTGVNVGTATISYSPGTGCLRTVVVTVNALPTITGTPVICVGSTVGLFGAPSGSDWYSNNLSVATVDYSGVVTGVAAGTTALMYSSPVTGCTRTVIATVNATPGTFSGTASMCQTTTTTLSNSVPGGTWSSSNAGVAAAAMATGIITGQAAGTSMITYRIGTCQATIQVTVKALPNTITGGTQTVVGATTTLSNSTPGGAWSSGNPAAGTISGSGVVTGLAAGTSVIVYTAPNACTRSVVVSINAVPALPGPRSVCVGSTINISSPTVSVSTWSSSDMSKATVASGVVTGVAPGTSTITYVLTAGGYGTTEVTVLASPAAITGSLNVCGGATTTLGSTTGGGTWLSSNSGIATVNAGGIVSGVAAGLATITYSLSTGCRRTVAVTVNPTPNPITGTASVCEGATMYPYLATIDAGTWSSGDITIATVPLTHGEVTGISAGTTLISFTNMSGCSVTREVTVSVCPSRGVLPGTTAVNLNDGNVNISFYPNPTEGTFMVSTPEAGMLSIYTLDGREVLSTAVKAGTTDVSLPSTLTTGIYMCRFTGNQGTQATVRMIYEHD